MPVNTLMKGYLVHNRAASAVQLAEQLPNNERNPATFLLWANAVANLTDRHMADRVHAALHERASTSRTLFLNDDRLMNALINVSLIQQSWIGLSLHLAFPNRRWMASVAILNVWRKHSERSKTSILSRSQPWPKHTLST